MDKKAKQREEFVTTRYCYNARVIRWIDGDTLEAEIDLGFKISMTKIIRLLGINTPEKGKEGHSEALLFCDNLLPPLSDFIFKSYKDRDGKYGRLLGTVFLNDHSMSLNERLLENKMSEYYNTPSRTILFNEWRWDEDDDE